MEEQCQHHLLFESSDIGSTVCPWEKNSLMLNEEGSGKDVVEEPREHNLHLPSTDPVYTVYILPAAQPIPKEPAPAVEAKAIPPSLPVQNFRKLIAFVQTFVTTSKKMAAAHTSWHSGWFRFGAPGPHHFYKLYQFQQPPKA